MTERPILFSDPMVRALIGGRKTQTRRAVKPQPKSIGYRPLLSFNQGRAEFSFGPDDRDARGLRWWRCPYGQPGDLLWVREAHAIVPRTAFAASEGVQQTLRPGDDHDAAIYRVGWDRSRPSGGWKPSIHMPRWASRLTLEVTDVRLERLADCSETDAVAEGVEWCAPGMWSVAPNLPIIGNNPRDVYFDLWAHINGEASRASNPWVWAVSFAVVPGPAK